MTEHDGFSEAWNDAREIGSEEPRTAPGTNGDTDVSEFMCPDCNRRCTRGPDGTEFGHQREHTGGGERCPRRPESVDPVPIEERV